MNRDFVGASAAVTVGRVKNSAMIPFSWKNPYAWPRNPLPAQNVVATSPPAAPRWTRSSPPRSR